MYHHICKQPHIYHTWKPHYNSQFDIINFFSLILAIVAIGVAIWAWHKSRAIYDIKKFKFPKKVGESKNHIDRGHERALKEKLSSGKWQVLHIYDYNNDELMVVIGKTKKN